jgi:hypothetical protein
MSAVGEAWLRLGRFFEEFLFTSSGHTLFLNGSLLSAGYFGDYHYSTS